MEVAVDENELKAVGAQPLTDGRQGVRIHGWEIEALKRSILNSSTLQQYLSRSRSRVDVCIALLFRAELI